MPQVRILVTYPGDPHPSGAVIELEAREASQLVTEGRAEYIRDPGVERAVPQDAVESTTPRRRKTGRR
jgi:hypothetical protein